MERSWRLITALYGILKSGAAYVPVEPSQPDERMAFVLKGARPKVIITDNDRLNNLDFGNVKICAYGDFAAAPNSLSAVGNELPWGPAASSPAEDWPM